MCEDDEKKKPGEATKVCFFWLRGRCKFGRRCRFSHSRPTCRYADNCKYGPTQCWYSHSPTPKVSMLGGTSKGKNYFRNQNRRNKQKALKAEVITLKEKVKELGDQLELEKKKNEKLLAEQLCSKRAPPARRPPPPPQVQQAGLDLKSRRQDDPTPARSSTGGLLELCYSCGAKWGHEDFTPVISETGGFEEVCFECGAKWDSSWDQMT
mmetsp:Transcript_17552/g.24134  ORF Transcript_17552/g.24134 Transcript_17552/m.24134 type:complete len:209 (+) Transcript_17552:419-1045(+)